MKVVINRCYGGFSLSREAFLELRKMGNITALEEADIGENWKDGSGPRPKNLNFFCGQISRNDPDLIKVVETLKEKANGECAKLKIVEIPDDIEWEIDDYDGLETVSEKHCSWY